MTSNHYIYASFCYSVTRARSLRLRESVTECAAVCPHHRHCTTVILARFISLARSLSLSLVLSLCTSKNRFIQWPRDRPDGHAERSGKYTRFTSVPPRRFISSPPPTGRHVRVYDSNVHNFALGNTAHARDITMDNADTIFICVLVCSTGYTR